MFSNVEYINNNDFQAKSPPHVVETDQIDEYETILMINRLTVCTRIRTAQGYKKVENVDIAGELL